MESLMEVVVKTETPLDVLSRAACMLEHTVTDADLDLDEEKNGLKRSMDNCELQQSNEYIFGQMNKCRRLDGERNSLLGQQQQQQQLLNNNNNLINSSRKCAGTQTFFSSFVPPPASFYHPQPMEIGYHETSAVEDEPRFILDLDRHMARSTVPSNNQKPANVAAGLRRRAPPPENENNNTPLNLTLPSSKIVPRSSDQNVRCGQWSSSSSGSRIQQQNVLPAGHSGSPPKWKSGADGDRKRSNAATDFSKTTSLNRPTTTQHKIWTLSNDSQANAKTKERETSPRKSTSVVMVECDRDIEEHFQRSLGKDYPKCISKNKRNQTVCKSEPVQRTKTGAGQTSSSSSSGNLSPDGGKANVTISGAVDDHFAKSLGQTWTKLKSKSNNNNGRTTDVKTTTTTLPPLPGSVDDHFAKALGEAWFKLRVENENT